MVNIEIGNGATGVIVFSAKVKGKVVGRAELYTYFNDSRPEPCGFIGEMVVEEDFRRMGIATQLMKEVFRFKEKRKFRKVVMLPTERHTKEVHALCRKLGFKESGTAFHL